MQSDSDTQIISGSPKVKKSHCNQQACNHCSQGRKESPFKEEPSGKNAVTKCYNWHLDA